MSHHRYRHAERHELTSWHHLLFIFFPSTIVLFYCFLRLHTYYHCNDCYVSSHLISFQQKCRLVLKCRQPIHTCTHCVCCHPHHHYHHHHQYYYSYSYLTYMAYLHVFMHAYRTTASHGQSSHPLLLLTGGA